MLLFGDNKYKKYIYIHTYIFRFIDHGKRQKPQTLRQKDRLKEEKMDLKNKSERRINARVKRSQK